MRELSLFTGAGGGLLGTKLLGWHTVGYVEFDDYCQKVLAQRIQDGFLDEAPIFGDIDEFIESGASKKYAGFVDVVTAGFPCQPFSVAGKKKGQDDERNKWPQTIQCLRDVRPRYALLENVPGLLNSGYFGEILTSLAEAGFDARWCVLGADDVGAPHRRKRLWILAYTRLPESSGRIQTPKGQQPGGGRSPRSESASRGLLLADSDSIRLERPRPEQQATGITGTSEDVQDPERGRRLHGQHEERRVQVRQQRQSGSRSGERVSGDSSDVADSDSSGSGTSERSSDRNREKKDQGWQEQSLSQSRRLGEDVADSEGERYRGRDREERRDEGWNLQQSEQTGSAVGRETEGRCSPHHDWWSTEPDVGRVVNELAFELDFPGAVAK